ncbi:ArsR family transcriptional regulator [Salinigranum rubrum]|uniref:ArsR family transcriptional regulator n=1 Tax=Salinigranum rubrum TaxID=755307 RepID=A0A2I8VNG7_9EURY|nr:winged helix-turn-helix domain-containing protein [Salinigranum rubrum]AUV83435.1 ArsR family transcriptional regulator [Salinigranum rubrum]
MAGLLPSKPDIDPNDEPRVVGLDSDDADELIDALSSSTTREVLAALHEDPASASELATRVDTSLQNVQYHLRKLEDAGLVEVGDTVYSEKGREMNVYVPADRALVVVAGREEETTGLKAALSRLLGGVGVLGLASVVVDRLAREGPSVGFGTSAGGAGDAEGGGTGGGGADGGAAPPETPAGDAGASGGATPTPEPTATRTTTETATDVATETETGGGFEIAEATTTTTAPTEATTVTDAAAGTATPAPTAVPEATGTATEAATQTTTPLPEATRTATEAATQTPTVVVEATPEATAVTTAAAQPGVLDGLAASPGLLFFLGGTTVLLGGFALWWVRR